MAGGAGVGGGVGGGGWGSGGEWGVGEWGGVEGGRVTRKIIQSPLQSSIGCPVAELQNPNRAIQVRSLAKMVCVLRLTSEAQHALALGAIEPVSRRAASSCQRPLYFGKSACAIWVGYRIVLCLLLEA